MMAKDLSKAISLKEKGNSEYKSKRLKSSIKYYTKALFVAPCLSSVLEETADTLRGLCDNDDFKSYVIRLNLPPTDKGVKDNLILAHCYGNRSAAHFELKEYKAALVDIDLAMYNGYPSHEFKLYKRKALCLSHLGKQSDAFEVVEMYKKTARHLASAEIVEKLAENLMKDIRKIRSSSSCDEMITGPFVSSSLHIDTSLNKGRYIVAKKNISFGECVLSESPYVSVLYDEYTHTHCSHCFQETLNIIPCSYCVLSGYCSVSCLQTAWKLYHWAECIHGVELLPLDEQSGKLIGITVRLLLTSCTDVQVLLKECHKSDLTTAITVLTKEESTDISDLYKLVLKLTSNPNILTKVFMFGVNKIMECYSNIFESHFELEGVSLSSTMESLKEIVLLHMHQLQTNMMTAVDYSPVSEKKTLLGGLESEDLGPVLYLTASLFNHSCDYNLTRNFVGNRIELRACDLLLKGRELCITYVSRAMIGYTRKTERQKEIKFKRNFDCLCDVCIKPSKEILHREYGWYALSCPKCKGLLPEPDTVKLSTSPTMSKCMDCGQSTDITPLIKMESEILSRRNTSLNDILQTHKMLCKVLYKYNTKIVDYCDKAIQSLSSKGDYQSTLKYSKQKCDISEAIYGPYSMKLGNALYDHVHVLIECRDFRTSKQVAHRAMTILECYYGKDEKGAKDMREFLQSSILKTL